MWAIRLLYPEEVVHDELLHAAVDKLERSLPLMQGNTRYPFCGHVGLFEVSST